MRGATGAEGAAETMLQALLAHRVEQGNTLAAYGESHSLLAFDRQLILHDTRHRRAMQIEPHHAMRPHRFDQRNRAGSSSSIGRPIAVADVNIFGTYTQHAQLPI